MALLSQMMRTAAITGDPSRVNAWFADRQGKQWAERTVRRAFPQVNHRAPPADPAKTIEALTELRRRGVVTDAEVDALRSLLRV